jgi:hypothetical protein
VLRLNIEGKRENTYDISGYNYLGHYSIIIDSKEYWDFYGYHGLFYKTGNTKSKSTKKWILRE